MCRWNQVKLAYMQSELISSPNLGYHGAVTLITVAKVLIYSEKYIFGDYLIMTLMCGWNPGLVAKSAI